MIRESWTVSLDILQAVLLALDKIVVLAPVLLAWRVRRVGAVITDFLSEMLFCPVCFYLLYANLSPFPKIPRFPASPPGHVNRNTIFFIIPRNRSTPFPSEEITHLILARSCVRQNDHRFVRINVSPQPVLLTPGISNSTPSLHEYAGTALLNKSDKAPIKQQRHLTQACLLPQTALQSRIFSPRHK